MDTQFQELFANGRGGGQGGGSYQKEYLEATYSALKFPLQMCHYELKNFKTSAYFTCIQLA